MLVRSARKSPLGAKHVRLFYDAEHVQRVLRLEQGSAVLGTITASGDLWVPAAPTR